MALNEATNPQPRDQVTNPVKKAVNSGIGAVGSAVSNVGNAVSAPASSAPAYGGGGGGGGGGGAAPAAAPDYSALSALANAGLSSADIVALANGGGGAAAAPTSASLDSGFNNVNPAVTNVDSSVTYGAPPAVGDQNAGLVDPNLLALLASYDQQLNNTVSGYRRQQDEAQRSLADALPELASSFDLNRQQVKDAYEGRGLLKSGETEQAVGRTYTDQGRRQSQLEQQTADQVANIEQQIAQARVANQIARNQAQGAGAGQQVGGIVGSVA